MKIYFHFTVIKLNIQNRKQVKQSLVGLASGFDPSKHYLTCFELIKMYTVLQDKVTDKYTGKLTFVRNLSGTYSWTDINNAGVHNRNRKSGKFLYVFLPIQGNKLMA